MFHRSHHIAKLLQVSVAIVALLAFGRVDGQIFHSDVQIPSYEIPNCVASVEPVTAGHSTFAAAPTSSETIFPTNSAPLVPLPQPRHQNQYDVAPVGLLYRSYAAGPNEPRNASIMSYDVSAKSWRWDATLGGRVGFLRKDNPESLPVDAWQIDFEGAAMTRMNPQLQMDVESVDYRFGLLWTAKQQNVSYKLGYFHVSSHVGDEFLLKTTEDARRNFVRESLVLGTSIQATPEIRWYGEVAYGFSVSGGARPWQFQFGSEYAALVSRPMRGGPFVAWNVQMREEVNFEAGATIMAAWQWKGTESGRTLRLGLQYFNGPTNQFEFYQQYDHQLGLGIWFDY